MSLLRREGDTRTALREARGATGEAQTRRWREQGTVPRVRWTWPLQEDMHEEVMIANWSSFNPSNPLITALGNEAFGAYCRAAQYVVHAKIKNISPSEVQQITSDEIWARIVNCGLAKPTPYGFTMVAIDPGAKKKRGKETFPDDLELDDKARVFAEKKGFRGSQIEEMWERFDAYHRSGATESADWSASWRTWVLNQIRFGERPQAQVAPPRPYQPSLADLTERTDLAPAPRRGARF